jgi:hypothetical protein
LPSFLKQLAGYGTAQLKANPVAVLNIGVGLTNGLLNKIPLPPQAKGLLKGVIAAVATVAIRNAVTPTHKPSV